MSHPDWFDQSPQPDESGQGGPPPRQPRPVPAQPKRRGALGPTLAVLAVLFFLVTAMSGLVTDLWWFDSVGYRNVFVIQLVTKVLLFAVGFVLTALAVWSSISLGHRLRPFVVPTTVAQQTLEQYRRAIEPLRRLGTIIIPGILAVLAGAATLGAWPTYLLWRNGSDFGVKEPHFGIDVGFFVFDLPWWRFVVSFLTVVLMLALVAALLTHYVYGGLQLPGRGPSTRAAMVHIGALGALLALTRAAAYWLDRYSLTTEDSALITGLTYTRDHAVLPTRSILAAAALMCAAFFIAAMFTSSLRLPIIGVALLTVTAVLVGTVYPALVQSLKVKPSERSLEAPYITRNIEATRAAYGIDDIKTQTYAAVTDAEPGQLRENAETIPGIRLVDPNVVSRTFQQFEGLRQYYAFPDTLDVDRYAVDGKTMDSVVSVRELRLSGVPAAQRNWVNDHTVYTHGFGFVAAYGNQRTGEGDPVFFSGGLGSSSDAFGEYEPRVYFGEESPVYSVVGGPAGSEPREFDFPDDSGAGGQQRTTYAGEGGVGVGSFIRKLAYAVKYREPKLILSDQVTGQSRLLDHRSPKERVERVAPWLTLDGAGQLVAELQLREGRLQAGSHVEIPDVQLSALVAGHHIRGQARASGRIENTADAPRAVVELDLPRYEVMSAAAPDIAMVRGKDLRIDLQAPDNVHSFRDSARAHLRFADAHIPDLGFINAWLPTATLELKGGSTTLGADLELDATGSIERGRVAIKGRNTRLRLGETGLAGDFDLDANLDDTDLAVREFDLSGTRLALRNVSVVDAGRTAGENWWARMALKRGRIAGAAPFSVDADLGIEMQNVGLLMALFSRHKDYPGWAIKLADKGNLQANGKLRAASGAIVIDRLEASNERFDLKARLHLANRKARGDLLLGWHALALGLELDGDKRQFHLLKSRAWYASRPDLLGKSAAAR